MSIGFGMRRSLVILSRAILIRCGMGSKKNRRKQ